MIDDDTRWFLLVSVLLFTWRFGAFINSLVVFHCSTPSKPVHCIVWAKQLFILMFGKVEESMLYEDSITGQSAFMDQVEFAVSAANPAPGDVPLL